MSSIKGSQLASLFFRLHIVIDPDLIWQDHNHIQEFPKITDSPVLDENEF